MLLFNFEVCFYSRHMQFYVVKTELFGKAPIPFYYDICYLLATSAKNCPVFFKIKMPNYEINVHKIMIFLACECSTYGSSSPACGSSGECTCKSNFTGTKCASCNTGYYNYPNCYCKIYCIIL